MSPEIVPFQYTFIVAVDCLGFKAWRASWVWLDRCGSVTGDAVYNHQYGCLHSKDRTAMPSTSIRKHAGIPVPETTSVHGIRIAFEREVSNSAETREVFVEMVRLARQR